MQEHSNPFHSTAVGCQPGHAFLALLLPPSVAALVLMCLLQLLQQLLYVFMLQFLPERWSEPHADKDPSTGATKFVPFSLGPKACAGQNLALLQCKAALAVLLAAYEWSLAPSMG